jgi:hypothetical protein
MNLLLLSRAEVERAVGKKSVMTPNLLGMNLQGEKAFLITSPSMNEGYDLTIGFFNNKARYLVFKKKSSTRWNEGDVRVTLMQVGPFSNWSSKPGSDFFDYLEKEGNEIIAEATGWQTPRRKYCFIYIPVVQNEVLIAPDKAALDAKI